MNKKSNQIAERNYTTEDYTKDDELSQALSQTHEQASDAYMQHGTRNEERTSR
ncbi:DUF4025 domain-containing protein [Gracilibacillus oryzae]|uniref:DUF4025 domain-containing protein n=1 Tax=Gracilibacillus oryzae TaxID=1672701 RepID=A0A7C8GWE1_9BACI|nr:DUF4025 domain-containing protein [Gracilibacillus oryzae]